MKWLKLWESMTYDDGGIVELDSKQLKQFCDIFNTVELTHKELNMIRAYFEELHKKNLVSPTLVSYWSPTNDIDTGDDDDDYTDWQFPNWNEIGDVKTGRLNISIWSLGLMIYIFKYNDDWWLVGESLDKASGATTDKWYKCDERQNMIKCVKNICEKYFK